jgi:hypothetical protein
LHSLTAVEGQLVMQADTPYALVMQQTWPATQSAVSSHWRVPWGGA